MKTLVQAMISGLVFGAIYAIMTVGMTRAISLASWSAVQSSSVLR